MPDKQLHIISFDIPFPPNYGGVIDVFYKIKSLHEEGVKIHLHCFEYGRLHAKELERYCQSISYYKRKSGFRRVLGSLPYIAVTRSSEKLLENLLGNDCPVLFEGLHCCYHLSDVRLKSRIKIARSHNIEHDYYANLARVERNIVKKYYFSTEAQKLRAFESVYKHANHVVAISKGDEIQLSGRYANVSQLPAFHPSEKISVKEGRGDFVLYHGNLAIGENNEAAVFLLRSIFNDIKIPFVIAGNNPSRSLVAEVKKYQHAKIVSNISTESIYDLVADAQINILPTFQATGIKLKLLSALFNGRHCLVNTPMVANTGLESLCSVKDSPEQIKNEVIRLFNKNVDALEINKRKEILLNDFSNKKNAKQLVQLIWNQ